MHKRKEVKSREPKKRMNRNGFKVLSSIPFQDAQPKVDFVSLGSSVIPPPAPPPVIPQEEPKPSSVVDRGLPLPSSYDCDRVVALPKDPKWVFCYWELTGSVLREVKEQRGEDFVESAFWVLRVHRINERVAVDIEVDPSLGGWYINVGCPGRYQFEISLVSPDGEFISLAASGVITTPSDSMSTDTDEQWISGLKSEELERYIAQMLGLRGGRFWSQPSSGGLVKGPGPGLPHSANFAGASWGGQLSGRPVGSMEFLGGSMVASMLFMGASGMPGSLPGSLQVQMQRILHASPHLERPEKEGGPNWNAQPDLPNVGSGRGGVRFPRVLKNVPLPKCTWPRIAHFLPKMTTSVQVGKK